MIIHKQQKNQNQTHIDYIHIFFFNGNNIVINIMIDAQQNKPQIYDENDTRIIRLTYLHVDFVGRVINCKKNEPP